MKQYFYFGKDASFAIMPHRADNLNAAIHVKHTRQRAIGPVHAEVFLSNLECKNPKGKIRVKFYCADATNQAQWFDPRFLIKEWPLEFPKDAVHCEKAPVDNCIWRGEVKWDPERFRKLGLDKDDYYALLAVLLCDDTDQAPSEDTPATDPTVAVYNSLVVSSDAKDC